MSTHRVTSRGYKPQAGGGRQATSMRSTHAWLRLALILLLFALVFSITLTSIISSNSNFAEALASRNATKRTASSIATTGTNFAAEFNNSSNHTSTYASYFGIDAEVSTATNNFGWGSRGWGFDDVDLDGSDKAIAYWIEWEFTGTAKAAIQQNRASFYIKATSTYEGDFFEKPDETAIAFQWVGVQNTAPSASHVSSSRSNSDASWSSSVTSSTFAYKTGWGDGSANAEWGTKSAGAYQTTSPVPTNATGARLICYVITDHNIKGGIHDLDFSLYEKPVGSIDPSSYTFDLSQGLYGGDGYTLNNANMSSGSLSSNFSTKDGSGGTWNTTDGTLSNSNTVTPEDARYTYATNPNKKGSGILVAVGDKNLVGTASLTWKITIPEAVTAITLTGTMSTGGVTKGERGSGVFSANNNYTLFSSVTRLYTSDTATGTAAKSSTTRNIYNTSPDNNTSMGKSQNNKKNVDIKGTDVSINFSNVDVSSVKANDGLKTLTLELYCSLHKDDMNGWGDEQQFYAILHSLSIKLTQGTYSVKFDGNGKTSGTMSNQTFTYGKTDTKETLTKNTYKKTDNTFIGWALESFGSKIYDDEYNTSTGEITNVPGATVTLYAVWRESDFGVLSGKSKDGTWGTENNPFVISELEHWHNLVGIVNQTQEAVDSVQGTHYGAEIGADRTSAKYTTFLGCYFAVTADLELGNITPIGTEATIYNQGPVFLGHIYGADNSNVKTMRKITVAIEATQDNVGLFGYWGGAKGNSSSIEYLWVDGSIKTTGKYAGGFVGNVFGESDKTISHCKSTVNVIVATFNTANQATGIDGAAGFVGAVEKYSSYNSKLTIDNCEYVGGTKVTEKDTDGKTVVDANIFGGNGVGGILGHVVKDGNNIITVSNCKASGTIQGVQNVGGIGGRIETTSTTADSIIFKNLYNSANISVSSQTAGGIVGYFFGNSTGTNNVATLQYAYNCGKISGASSTNYIGGIVGEAKKNTAGSVTLKNCYNAGTLANFATANAGSIVGQTTNTTITDCWQFNISSGDASASFSVSGSNGSNNSVKKFSSYSGTTILPATSADKTIVDGWEKIAEGNDFDAFGLFAGDTTITDGSFLCIYDDTGTSTTVTSPSGTIVNPAAITSSIESGTLFVKNIVFFANITNDRLAVTKRTITTASTTQTKTYGDAAPAESLWITTGSNLYTDSVDVAYLNSTWSYDAPINANTGGYNIRVELYNNKVLVGAKVLSSAYKINKKSLVPTTVWDPTTLSSGGSVQYDGEHQGLTSLTLASPQYGQNIADLVKVEFSSTAKGTVTAPTTATGSWTFSGAINAASYTVKVSLNSANANSANYTLNGSTNDLTYSWNIAKRVLHVKSKFSGETTFGTSTSKTFTYNADQQGLAELQIANLYDNSESFVKGLFSSAFKADFGTSTATPNKAILLYPAFDSKNKGENYSYTLQLTAEAQENFQFCIGDTETGAKASQEFTWKINPRTLGFGTNNWTAGGTTDHTYVYNASFQGLQKIRVGNIQCDADKKIGLLNFEFVGDGLKLREDNNPEQDTSDTKAEYFHFDGAISKGSYKIIVTSNDQNYSLPGATDGKLSYEWQIDPCPLTVKSWQWSDGKQTELSKSFVFDWEGTAAKGQGLRSITLSGVIAGENPTELEVSHSDVIGYGSLAFSSGTTPITGTYTQSKLPKNVANGYTVTLKLIDKTNYTLDGKTDDIVFTWNITEKPLGPGERIDSYETLGVRFGYEVRNTIFDVTNPGTVLSGSNYYDLSVLYDQKYNSTSNTFEDLNFATDSANLAVAILYYNGGANKTSKDNVTSLLGGDNKMVLRWDSGARLRLGTDFTLSYKFGYDNITDAFATANSWQDVIDAVASELDKNSVAKLMLRLEGQGNYKGMAYVRMAIMQHDFGGFNAEHEVGAIWGGSEGYPYLIEDEIHLLRLMGIVNGTAAHGDSVNGTVSGITFSGAATDTISYEGAYFKVTAETLSASTERGFVPIGKDEGNPFSGTFDGASQSIQLALGSSSAQLTTNYVGLFGYLKGATVKNINLYGAIYAKCDYVGAIAGHADGVTLSGNNISHAQIEVTPATVSSGSQTVTVGNYVGGFIGRMTASANDHSYIDIRVGNSLNVAINGGVGVKGGEYVGGMFGLLENTLFVVDLNDGVKQVGLPITIAMSVSGDKYVGYFAGMWKIPAYEDPQTSGASETDTYSNFADVNLTAEMAVTVGYYDGATSATLFGGMIAGYLDASAATGVTFTPSIKKQTVDSTMTVKGRGFIGGLFGAFVGGTNTVVKVIDSNIAVTVDAANSAGYVFGGLFGYVEAASVQFADAFTDDGATGVTLSNTGSASFVGGIAGIIGKSAYLGLPSNYSGEVLTSVTMSEDYTGVNYVGSIAGFMSYSAGDAASDQLRTFGSKLSLKATGDVSGTKFVGGLFGAIGSLSGQDTSAWTQPELKNILTLGGIAETEAVKGALQYSVSGGGKLVYAAASNKNIGKSDATYVGGLIGYAGTQASLNFVNDSQSSATALDMSVLAVSVKANRIIGKQYVGGVVGFAENTGHTFTRVAVIATSIGANSATSATGASASYTYIGGIAGQLEGGGVQNSIVAINTGTETVTSSSSLLLATEHAGGIAGHIGATVTISQNFTLGVAYNAGTVGMVTSSTMTIGGIVGSSEVGATLTNSWAYHIAAEGTTYSTVSQNTLGKYLVISQDLREGSVLFSADDIAKAAGIVGSDAGKITFTVVAPAHATNKTDRQIAFYDVSGNNKVTQNTFESMKGSDREGRPAVTVTLLSSLNSMMVLAADIVYRDPYPFTGTGGKPNGVNEQNKAEQSYFAPGGDDKAYGIHDYGNLSHTFGSTGSVEGAKGDVYYSNDGGKNWVKVGHFEKSFTPGSADTPYYIYDKNGWLEVKEGVAADANRYNGKFVKLMADITTEIDLASEAISNFEGTFDGNGHTIKVKYSGNGNGISLFPYTQNATFKNLTISGTINAAQDVTDTGWWKQGSGIAAFVGSVAGVTIFENCVNKADVTGVQAVGGLIGNYECSEPFTMIGCVNEGNITSTYGQSKENFNYDKGTGGMVGAVSANIEITIESCRNKGNITGGHNVGGIIGLNEGALNIYNCANTGNIFANLGNSQLWDNTHKASYLVNNYAYAGGIVGRVGKAGVTQGSLNMYASYNTGEIMATGNFAGGLVGAIGSFITGGNIFGHSNGVYFDNTSTSIIAYCYNAGHVWAGTKMPIDADNKVDGGKYQLVAVCGGLIGVMGEAKVSYCYNVGKVTSNGLTGADGHWHSRMGGIVGEAEPADAKNLSFNYCYNIGELVCEVVNPDIINCARYGAGILGYIDTESDGKIVSSNSKYNYTLKNSLRYCAYTDETCSTLVKPSSLVGATSWRGEANISDDGSANLSFGDIVNDCMLIGSVVDSLSDLTAYMTSDNTFTRAKATQAITTSKGTSTDSSTATLVDKGETGAYINKFNDDDNKVTYDEDFLNATLNGYIYIYGCLPTLSMFAVDTKEGLSMLSVSYGYDESSGQYVGAQAGSKQSPYIIKDGVDMLGMSALVNAYNGFNYYTFRDKYIEIAHSDSSGSNNIDNLNVTSIDMATLKNNTSTQGKNWYLYEKSAAGRAKDFPSTVGRTDVGSESYATWAGKNNYYDGTKWATGKGLEALNFIPLGNCSNSSYGKYYRFEGDFEGNGATIQNIMVSIANDYNAYAAVFGKTQGATISNLKLADAKIYAYYLGTAAATSQNAGAIAGGIVAWAGGGTTIENCTVTDSDIRANANKESLSGTNAATNPTNGNSYVGGIAGVVVSGKSSGTSIVFTAGETVTISGCTVIGTDTSTKIYGYGSNIGGIVGRATGASVAHANTSTSGDAGGTNVVISDNSVSQYIIIRTLANSTHAQANTGIGGVVGVIDGKPITTLADNTVGVAVSGKTYNVSITGDNMTGGMVGYSYGKTSLRGTVGEKTTITYASITGPKLNTTYGTAMGGVIGYGKNIVFDGLTTYEGALNLNASNSTVATENVGGIIGYMDSGCIFAATASVSVTGSISINNKAAPVPGQTTGEYNQNIGGLAGYSAGATFAGTFSLSPTIAANSGASLAASNVGGFIGYNAGATYIHAATTPSERATSITVTGTISGVDNVGGFVGQNANGAKISIGLDADEGGATYSGGLEIKIGKLNGGDKITASGDYVGGLIGFNAATETSVTIQKGSIYNYANVSGTNYVGGVIGGSMGILTTGGGATSLDMRNYGAVSGTDVDNSRFVGGIIGYHAQGSLAGYYANIGSVTGGYFVGGSIGYVGENGELVIQINTVTGEALGDTQFTNCGEVTGIQFVGGSIGASAGEIIGTQQYQVTFTSTTLKVCADGKLMNSDGTPIDAGATGGTDTTGKVEGKNYVGGVIGLLSGNVTFGEFVNNCYCKVDVTGMDGAGSIGGAIGMIGVTSKIADDFKGLLTQGTGVVTRSVFEYNVELGASTADDGQDVKSFTVTGKALGVGGVIGVITAGAQFDRTNNFFVTGDVTAVESDYVGGAVGFVLANNVELRNILLDHSKVTGKQYVGGIVGSIGGTGVNITNCFNLHGSIVAGEGVESKYQGGIVGGFMTTAEGGDEKTIAESTNARTSYWVPNEALDGSGALTSKYIQDAVDNGTWIAGGENEKTNIGSPSTGWIFVIASDLAMVYDDGKTEATDGVHTKGFYGENEPTDYGVIGLHAEGGHDLLELQLKYWKRIANNYSIAERTTQLTEVVDGETVGRKFADGTPITAANEPLESFISKAGTDMYGADGNNDGHVAIGWLYAAASSSVPGRYLTMSTQTANIDASGSTTAVAAITGFDGRETGVSVKHADITEELNYSDLSGEQLNYAGYKNAVTEGSYHLTYIAINANNRTVTQNDDGTDNIQFSNTVGNIAIYYRAASNVDGEGKADVVDFGSNTYNGKPQSIDITKASDSIFKKEFNDIKPYGVEEEGGGYLADTYYYALRLAHITENDPEGAKIFDDDATNNGNNYTDAGLYEGYLDIYLFDQDGNAKVVGSVQFVYQITPAEVTIESTPTSGYYDGEAKTTRLQFKVGDMDWAKHIYGETLPSINARTEFFEYVRDLQLYFRFVASNGTSYMDDEWSLDPQGLGSHDINFGGTIKTITVTNITDNDYQMFNVSGMVNVGSYELASKSTKLSYTYEFKDGAWQATATKYVITDDNNYCFKGADDKEPKEYNGEGSTKSYSYPFFEMMRMQILYSWEANTSKTYNGETFDVAVIKFFTGNDVSGKQLTFTSADAFYDEIKASKLTLNVTGKMPRQFTFEEATLKESRATQLIFSIPLGPNAGTYTTTLSSTTAETDNSQIEKSESSADSNVFTITGAPITVEYEFTSGTRPYTYNGKQQGANVKLSGFVAKDLTSAAMNLNSAHKSSLGFSIILSPSGAYAATPAQEGTALTYSLDATSSVNAAAYTVTITFDDNGNYMLRGGNSPSTSTSWEIQKYTIGVEVEGGGTYEYDGSAHELTLKLTSSGGTISRPDSTGRYTIKPFADANDTLYFIPKFDGLDSAAAVNVGKYELDVQQSTITAGAETLISNYDIQETGSSGSSNTIEITQAHVAIVWEEGNLRYKGVVQGISIADLTIGTQNKFKVTNRTYTPASSTVASITVTNANGDQEIFRFTISGNQNRDVGEYTARIASNAITVSGANASGSISGSVAKGNYSFDTTYTKSYSITKVTLTATSVNFSDLEKTYDGNATVPNEKLTSVVFSGLVGTDVGSLVKGTHYTVTATYDTPNVGSGKTVDFVVKVTDTTINKNYNFTDNVSNATNGEITPATLTVKLNLKSGAATKVYDGNTSYGGAGVTSGTSANSKVYRSGNGFSVSGFVSGESGVTVTAEFQETDRSRSAFDAFVNGLGLKSGQTSGKQLVFTLNSNNYKLQFSDTAFDVRQNANTYTLTAKNDAQIITITKKQVSASYQNTAQSYANPDNSYNTVWKEVTGTLSGVVNGDSVKVDVTNGWMYENGKDGALKEYHSHTVIPGSENSTILKVQLVSTAADTQSDAEKCEYQNYTLKNYPTLVIGYFVSSDAFEIGSLAGLLIASYYYSASTDEFGAVLPNNVIEHEVCSKDQYDNDEDVPDGSATWDEYFDKLGYEVFLDEAKNMYVYLEEQEGEPVSYTSFKLVKDISGVFTQGDLEMLEHMFHQVKYNDDGTYAETPYNWGYGQSGNTQFLTNVLKGSVGDTVTILNSLFGDFAGKDGGSAVFDGNGYVIDGFNLMGGVNGETTNAGLFGIIGTGATVKDLHLRNANVVADGVQNVGGLAGKITAALDETAGTGVLNVSVHGMFNVTGTNVGGIVGNLTSNIKQAIALGTLYASGTDVGGIAGASTGSISAAVSMMYIWATGATNVGGIVGSGNAGGNAYLKNSVWNSSSAVADSGNSVIYDDMYSGSTGGYGDVDFAYYKAGVEKGTYDVLDDVTTENMVYGDGSDAPAPRQSMRLRDIIDVYLLQYSLSASTVEVGGKTYNIYKKSTSSWLVGTADGTNSNPIVIANQQGVSLLRELRFASFSLAADVYMYSTYKLETYKGAFFGKIESNGHHIYIKNYDETTQMFEAFAAEVAVPLYKY